MTNRQIKEKQKTNLHYGFRICTGTRAGKLDIQTQDKGSDIRAQICQLFPGMAACRKDVV
ncbi:hypothetical protein [Candidatus Parabeggiatoa sp. HSG14]|uniref:hypothetical protein n=1 Tax=Candidatus Parabeggiatoa sp. HSG14 TaxID=3055593 RepID=UPI0025A7D294|nr:hypothetical protein [Thiotrichales bacterium HSG14]